MARAAVLVVDDEADIREILEYNLRREGYDLYFAADGETGLRLAREKGPDLILLDLMLPGIDGIEVCRRLKQSGETRAIPVLMLTAKGEETDAVLGLGVGAVDYVRKPFGVKELLARVRTALRRVEPAEAGGAERIVRGEIAIDSERHEVTISGKPVPLTLTEFRLLRALAARPGRAFTRAELIERAVGGDAFVVDRNIDVHVRALRKKLGPAARYLETVRGVGYRFADRLR